MSDGARFLADAFAPGGFCWLVPVMIWVIGFWLLWILWRK